MVDDEILAYYEDGRESARLLSGDGLLEFLRTQELLERFLPPPPAAVLDVGGGAGIHALPLARRGYSVSLVDPVSLHVGQARAASGAQPEAPLAEIVEGDARRLPFDDSSMDAVLLLGPLYHLVDTRERLLALREAARVVKPGGLVLAAIISRFASTIDGLRHGLLAESEFEEIVKRDLATGVHENPSRRRGWFTTSYFHHPDELERELGEAGLSSEALVAIEGLGSLTPDVEGRLQDKRWREILLRAIRRVESERSLLGVSSHVLGIGRRPPRV